MNEYKVELKIIGHENLEVMKDYQTAHLMMLSEYVTIAGNTIRVGYKEASSEGNIKLYKNCSSPYFWRRAIFLLNNNGLRLQKSSTL